MQQQDWTYSGGRDNGVEVEAWWGGSGKEVELRGMLCVGLGAVGSGEGYPPRGWVLVIKRRGEILPSSLLIRSSVV